MGMPGCLRFFFASRGGRWYGWGLMTVFGPWKPVGLLLAVSLAVGCRGPSGLPTSPSVPPGRRGAGAANGVAVQGSRPVPEPARHVSEAEALRERDDLPAEQRALV